MEKPKNEKTEPTEAPGPKFHPSPIMLVRLGEDKIVAMNRKERRRRHIYGKPSKIEINPNPPPVFHSLEEMRESKL